MSEYDGHHPAWVVVALILATGLGYVFALCLAWFASL